MGQVINNFHSKKTTIFLYGMDSEKNDSSFLKLNFYSFFKPKNIKT
jgi:hypothetical protein